MASAAELASACGASADACPVPGDVGPSHSLIQTARSNVKAATTKEEGAKKEAKKASITPVDVADDITDDLEAAMDAVTPGRPYFSTFINWHAAAAEFVAMLLYVMIGCGTAMGIANKTGYAWVLQVALAFGFAATTLTYAVGHISGGQINPAITFGLWCNGNLHWLQMLANLVAQLLGSLFGALVLCGIFPETKDQTRGLGCNGVGTGWTSANALVGEIMMTFLLMFVVLQIPRATREIAVLAVGLAIFLAHSVLVPIDGCSINPARSFGPAVVAVMRYGKGDNEFLRDMWIFWVGPLVGSALAVLVAYII